MNINHATVVGRLTRDPELKALPSGMKVANFSIATSYTYKDKEDKKVETVEYHNIVFFGRVAEVCGQYLKKGQICGVLGRLQTRTWEKDGVKHYRTEIIGDKMDMGPKVEGAKSSEPKEQHGEEARTDQEGIDPNDIPF